MKKFLDNFEEYVIGVLFIICTFVVIFQAVAKFIVPSISGYTAEISQYIYEFIAFFGIGYCLKWGADLSIDLFGTFISGTALEQIFKLIGNYLYIIIYAILLYGSVRCAIVMIGVNSETAGIPMAPIYISAIAGFALGLIRWVQVNFLKKTWKKEEK